MILQSTIGFGTVLAITISWSLNRSLFWAIIHGILGWLYIIYYMLGDPNNDDRDK
ncbi:MAG: hypothetical protein ACOVQ2_02750 [Flavobacterium sp.]